MNITVINIHRDRKLDKRNPLDIYIGRDPYNKSRNFGNPFTHIQNASNMATITVATREEAVQCFEDWLRGVKWRDVEPERRLWVLQRIKWMAEEGHDLTLGCFCRPKNGFTNDHTCHGQVIARMILEARGERTNP